jgi:hypothetical protein
VTKTVRAPGKGGISCGGSDIGPFREVMLEVSVDPRVPLRQDKGNKMYSIFHDVFSEQ